MDYNLKSIELIDDGPADLAISAYDEVISESCDAGFVDH